MLGSEDQALAKRKVEQFEENQISEVENVKQNTILKYNKKSCDVRIQPFLQSQKIYTYIKETNKGLVFDEMVAIDLFSHEIIMLVCFSQSSERRSLPQQ